MLVVTGINGQEEMLVDYKEVKRKRRVNGEHSLSFYLLNTENVAHAYHLADKRAKITDANGDEYIVLGINKRGHYGKVITAVHIFFDDMMDRQYNLYNGYANFKQCMDFIFNGTGWNYINQGAFAATDFQNFGDDTRSALTQTALNRYEAEMKIDNKAKTAIFKNQIGAVTDAQFRYGHNLKTFEEDTDMSNFATVIRGYGKDSAGKEFMVEYESPMAKVYGRIHQKPIRDERYKTPETMLEACKKEINDVPDTRFKVSIANLIENGISPLHKFDLGDYVYMLYEEAGVTVQIRVIQIEDDPTDPTKSPIIELSTFKELKTMSAIQAQFQQTQKQVQQLLDDGGNLNLALKRLYMNTETFADHTGVWYIDPDDPNRYVHIGAGGLDVHRGLIRVERDDGYATIIGGKVQFDMAVSTHEPPFMGPGVDINAGWYATKNTDWSRCNFYTFKHTGRYLVFALSYATDEGAGAQIRIRENNDNLLWYTQHNKTIADDYYFNVVMDIGVPTGEMKYVLLEQASNSADHMSYVRVLSKWQEG